MTCPQCGAAVPQGKLFCGDCGAALASTGVRQLAEGGDPSASAPIRPTSTEAEHRPLTVAFCDLAGSTRLSTELDPEDLGEVITTYQRCVAETVAGHRGFIARYMGDGVLIYFGYPHAHEDDAERAVTAALALVEAVGQLRPAVIAEPLRIRVGIATGDVVIGDLIGTGAAQELVAVGATPNLAARLQALAEPGAVVIAADTKRMAAGRFDYRDLGLFQVKGFPKPIRAWQVVRASAAASRFAARHPDARTPLAGRKPQVDLLLRDWAQAKSGRGSIVLLSGEPGIGKSRLAAEMVGHLGGETFSQLRFSCSPEHVDSALHPVLARLERAAGLKRGDAPDRRLDKLARLLSASRRKAEDVALLAALLFTPANAPGSAPKLSPAQKKEQTLAALVAQFEALARQQPVLMVCEDVHWIDPTSMELLDRLAKRIAQLPAMILLTSRPEFEPRWLGQPYARLHHLERLDRHDAQQIIAHLAGGKMLPQRVTEEILERTDGVPLFVEELTKMILESGLLREDRGAFVLDGPWPLLAVPPTLQALLVARLDRLGRVKEVAQTASAIGREFTFDMLASVFSRPEHDLQAALDALTESGLVLESGARPRSVYAFKHALVQDAAYGTLLRSRRQPLHGRIAAALEGHFPEVMASQPEIVARHYTEAGMSAEAIGYWLKAGHLAGARSANVEARRHLTRGLALLQELPSGSERDRQELMFQTLLGPALIATKGHSAPESIAAYQRAIALIQTTGDTQHQDSVFFGLYSIYYNQGRLTEAFELGRELARRSEQRNETTSRLVALGMLAGMHNFFGEFASARDCLVQALSFYAPAGDRSEWRYTADLRISCQCLLAIALWHLGFPDQSIALERDALAGAERLNHDVTTAFVLSVIALSAFRRRDFDELRHCAARMQAYAREHSMIQLAAWATCWEGSAIAAAEPAKAVAQIEAGIGLCEKIKITAWQPVLMAGLAEAQQAAGRAKEALHTVEAALAIADHTRERWMNAELWRLKGCIVAELGAGRVAEDAEACFAHALACADQQQSKMLALRTATSLARLWDRQGLRSKGRELVASHCNSLTEGFATPDVLEATRFLDVIAGDSAST